MSGILPGETIYLADDHFDQDVANILQECVKNTGAKPALERPEASIVLTNPSSTAYRSEVEKTELLAKTLPDLKQTSIPYHWLTTSHHRKERIPFKDLDPALPIFTNPDRSRGHQPLRAWVSINLPRAENEQCPEESQAAVSAVLIRGGALMAKKRAQADLLIVDPTSQFYNTIKEEKAKYGRTHQKLAERDWVEDCFKNGKVVWVSEKDLEDESAEESFGEDDIPKGTGVGRPTGL